MAYLSSTILSATERLLATKHATLAEVARTGEGPVGRLTAGVATAA